MKRRECPDYRECNKTHDLRRYRPHCSKAKEQKVFTYADRIRAMSDEELANFLHNVVRKFMCEYCKEYERIKAAKGHATCNGECNNAYLEWLKQPAKEEV